MYQQFFSGSDVDVYISGPYDRIRLDKCSGISFAGAVTASPTYGIGDELFKFINSGNSIVSVNLDINFIHPDYLIRTITMVKNRVKQAVDTDSIDNSVFQKRKQKLTYEMVSAAKNYDSRLDRGFERMSPRTPESNSGIGEDGFDIIIALNNSNLYELSRTKSIHLINAKIMSRTMGVSSSDDGNLIERYSLLAKEIRTSED